MPLLKVEIIIDEAGKTEQRLIPLETVLEIRPLTSKISDSAPEGIIAYDLLDKNGKPKPSYPNSVSHVIRDHGDWHEDESGNTVEAVYPQGKPETFFQFFERTRVESANSLLVVRHPTGNGYRDDWHVMPQTIDEIVALQPDIKSIVDEPKADTPTAGFKGFNRLLKFERS